MTSLRWKPHKGASKTQNLLVSAQADGLIKYWHPTNGKELRAFNQEKGGVYALDFSQHGDFLATGGQDHVLRVYDENSQSLVGEFRHGAVGEGIPSHFNRIWAIKFDPLDDKIIYSGGWDKIVTVTDTRVKLPVKSISGPYICGDALDIHDRLLLTGSHRSKESLEVWDMRNVEAPAYVIDWQPETKGEGGMVFAAKYGTSPKVIVAGGSKDNEL